MRRILFFFAILSGPGLQAQSTHFEWGKQFTGGKSMSNTVDVDAAGNVYTSGVFTGTVDFDPGPGVHSVDASSGNYDMFICKLDPAGNLLWAIDLLPIGEINYIDTLTGLQFASIDVHAATGEVYAAGLFGGTVDMDPGPGVYNLSAPTGEAASFVCKLNTAGGLVWAKQLGGQKANPSFIYNSDGTVRGTYYWYHWKHNIDTDASGSVFIQGMFQGTRDFDPGSGTFLLTGSSVTPTSAPPTEGMFVVKLDASGNFEWAKTPMITTPYFSSTILPTGHVRNNLLHVDAKGNVYSAGYLIGTADFDPSAGSELIGTATSEFLWKLSPSGDFVWARLTNDVTSSAIIDDAGNIYTTGGHYIFNIFSGAGYECVIKKYNPDGTPSWRKVLDGKVCENHSSYGNSISLDANWNLLIAGYGYGWTDFDPGLDIYPYSMGSVFILSLDSDGNFKWVRHIRGMGAEIFGEGLDITSSPHGDVYTTSSFTGKPGDAIDVHDGTDIFPLSINGSLNIWGTGNNAFLNKMGNCSGNTSSRLTISSCGDYYLNTFVYSASGVYRQVIPNSTGCDSVITLDLTVTKQYVYRDDSITVCKGYSRRCKTGVPFCYGECTYSQSGDYIDTLYGVNSCDTIRTLHLTIRSAERTTISKSICPGDSYLGHSVPGTYSDSYVTSGGCDSISVLELSFKPVKTNVISKNICQGQSFMGHTTSGTYTDTLTTADSCDSLNVLQLTVESSLISVANKVICQGQSFEGYVVDGTYLDTFTSVNGCDSVRMLHLSVSDPPGPNLGPDAELCPGQKLTLDPGVFDTYLWQDGSRGQFLVVDTGGLYWVEVSNHCGEGTDEIVVVDGSCDLYFPSAFTPNNDGKNDAFRILGNTSHIDNYHLIIYNRWGQAVFQSSKTSEAWDGTLKGKREVSGTYVWFCRYTIAGSSIATTLKGTVTVVR
jgi:gliding motility-associated-like protein